MFPVGLQGRILCRFKIFVLLRDYSVNKLKHKATQRSTKGHRDNIGGMQVW